MSSYIGNSPQSGVFRKLDALTFNGSTTTFNITCGGASTPVGDASQLFISLNGVIQEPGVAFTLASGGTQLVFSSAPTNGMAFFGVLLGVKGAPTIDDGQVTTVKIADDAVTTDKILDDTVTDAKIDSLSASKLTGALPAIDGSALTGIDALPSQTGHAGEYLKTDGTTASWEELNPNKTTFGMFENAQIITEDYTITDGNNAMSAGPITIADGVDVVIPDGSTWTIS
jgi:hypothetical protein